MVNLPYNAPWAWGCDFFCLVLDGVWAMMFVLGDVLDLVLFILCFVW